MDAPQINGNGVKSRRKQAEANREKMKSSITTGGVVAVLLGIRHRLAWFFRPGVRFPAADVLFEVAY